jgi:allophanate hydrolase
VSLREKIRDTYRRIREKGERPVWIHLIPEEVSIARAEALGPPRSYLPLHGMTFAIKDNIDLADVPTTAGCPAYAYVPGASATVVERLMAAGAIPIGKTNLDQFATGLVGTRSPYGACSSVFNKKYISGGSSSGSAVAVASGLVDFALGTDTAGSGRVPASFNGIIGLKPTKGALSTSGVVPACKTQDCVSIFTTTIADAGRVFAAARGFDPTDGYSRAPGQTKAWPPASFRFGVPRADQLNFFGDESAPALFREAVAKFESQGGTRVEFDYAPFNDVANLLYSGPWVAERLAAIQDFATRNPEALHPVTAKIILNASTITAASAFKAMYRLADLTRVAAKVWSQMDFMLLPTAGAAYTHDEVAADPIQLNTNLGYYTNFVNLLDLSALAIPAGVRSNGIPFGVTLIGPAWSDGSLLATCGLDTGYCPEGYVPLAVCGAHLSGQPLNFQLKDADGFLIEATQTSSTYRLYALAGTDPPKPGLVMADSGNGIEVEVWAVPENSFGRFVAAVPAPLAIGTCTLQSGRTVKSFVCEPGALENAEEITALGGWRAYLAQRTISKT